MAGTQATRRVGSDEVAARPSTRVARASLTDYAYVIDLHECAPESATYAPSVRGRAPSDGGGEERRKGEAEP